MKTQHLAPTVENCRWQRITDFFMKRRRYRRDEMLCLVVFFILLAIARWDRLAVTTLGAGRTQTW